MYGRICHRRRFNHLCFQIRLNHLFFQNSCRLTNLFHSNCTTHPLKRLNYSIYF